MTPTLLALIADTMPQFRAAMHRAEAEREALQAIVLGMERLLTLGVSQDHVLASSSTVEQAPVKRTVAGSNPASPAAQCLEGAER